MAKKVTALIKLQVNAGKATPAPPIGPALGQHGVNIPGFCKEFNDRTAKWTYTIASYSADSMSKKRKDLVKAKEEPKKDDKADKKADEKK